MASGLFTFLALIGSIAWIVFIVYAMIKLFLITTNIKGD